MSMIASKYGPLVDMRVALGIRYEVKVARLRDVERNLRQHGAIWRHDCENERICQFRRFGSAILRLNQQSDRNTFENLLN